MERLRVRAHGIDFTCLKVGDGARLVLLLHGFPDDAGSMLPLAERFAADGYTAVAPWMRGYPPSGVSPDGRYRLRDLGADAAALVEALGFRQAVLVGHDWGAASSYLAVNLAPERFSHLVALSVPPNRMFLRGLGRFPAQRARSWYMGFFQLPFSERRVRRDDLAFIDTLWADWSPGWTPPPGRLDEVKATLVAPGALDAALAYYRELGRLLVRHPRDAAETWEVGARPIRVPTLLMVGERDGCIGPEIFADTRGCFDAPHRVEIVPAAGHFLPLEATDRVYSAAREWITLGPSSGG